MASLTNMRNTQKDSLALIEKLDDLVDASNLLHTRRSWLQNSLMVQMHNMNKTLSHDVDLTRQAVGDDPMILLNKLVIISPHVAMFGDIKNQFSDTNLQSVNQDKANWISCINGNEEMYFDTEANDVVAGKPPISESAMNNTFVYTGMAVEGPKKCPTGFNKMTESDQCWSLNRYLDKDESSILLNNQNSDRRTLCMNTTDVPSQPHQSTIVEKSGSLSVYNKDENIYHLSKPNQFTEDLFNNDGQIDTFEKIRKANKTLMANEDGNTKIIWAKIERLNLKRNPATSFPHEKELIYIDKVNSTLKPNYIYFQRTVNPNWLKGIQETYSDYKTQVDSDGNPAWSAIATRTYTRLDKLMIKYTAWQACEAKGMRIPKSINLTGDDVPLHDYMLDLDTAMDGGFLYLFRNGVNLDLKSDLVPTYFLPEDRQKRVALWMRVPEVVSSGTGRGNKCALLYPTAGFLTVMPFGELVSDPNGIHAMLEQGAPSNSYAAGDACNWSTDSKKLTEKLFQINLAIKHIHDEYNETILSLDKYGWNDESLEPYRQSKQAYYELNKQLAESYKQLLSEQNKIAASGEGIEDMIRLGQSERIRMVFYFVLLVMFFSTCYYIFKS